MGGAGAVDIAFQSINTSKLFQTLSLIKSFKC